MGVKGKPDIIERKRLQRYGHVKRMPKERIPKLITEWILSLNNLHEKFDIYIT